MKQSNAAYLAAWFVLGGAIFTSSCEQKNPSPIATSPPIVQVAIPLERVVTESEVFTARTQAVQSVNIKARATGYLTKLGFKDGDFVKQGQILFEIDKRPYQAQLDVAKGNVERLEGQKKLLQTQVERYTKLVASNAASQQDLDIYHGQFAENVGALEAAKAQVQVAQINLAFCSVTAPIDGRIDRHFFDIGDLVSQDTSLLTNIVSLKPIWAYFDVDQNTATRYRELVRSGQVKSARTSEIPVQMGLGDSRMFPIDGIVDFVSNQLDPNTGSIRLRAVFPNDDGLLLAGLFGRIRLPVSAPHSALLVIDSAIGTNQGDRFVLVVDDKNQVEYRPVDVGQLYNGLREVMRSRQVNDNNAEGKSVVRQVPVLSPTDRIIIAGLQRVRPGATVNPKLVDMLTLLPADTAPSSTGVAPKTSEKK